MPHMCYQPSGQDCSVGIFVPLFGADFLFVSPVSTLRVFEDVFDAPPWCLSPCPD